MTFTPIQIAAIRKIAEKYGIQEMASEEQKGIFLDDPDPSHFSRADLDKINERIRELTENIHRHYEPGMMLTPEVCAWTNELRALKKQRGDQ